MEYILLILVMAVIVGGAIIAFKVFGKPTEGKEKVELFLQMLENIRKEMHESSFQNRQELQKQLEGVNNQLVKGISESSRTIQEQFKQSADIIKDVTLKLSKLDETNKQVVNFAEQMRSLENILKNPKQRGILGEYFLETLLKNVLPPNLYKIQYEFSNGEIVDAAIFYNQKIIPIDSKFSLEKYNKIMEETDQNIRERMEKEFKADIKKRIDETAKYIKPNENTTDFAFMFIPAEGIYYNLLIYKQGTIELSSVDLIEYAFKKHVIIVSPTSFYAYLETVMLGLKAVEMEKNVQEIIKKVDDLSKHLNSYQVYMQKTGNALNTTVNMYNQANKEFVKIDKDIRKISGDNSELKPELIEASKADTEQF